MRNPVWPSSCLTPAGTSIDVQNKWKENTHTHLNDCEFSVNFVSEIKCWPVQRLGGGGDVTICPRFGKKRYENSSYRGHIIWPTPWSNAMNSGQACQPCRGSCSPIPGRSCFDDLPGDKIVVFPPSPIDPALFLKILVTFLTCNH